MVNTLCGWLGDTGDRSRGRQLKLALLFTFLLGLAAHGMQFLSLAPSHDYLFSFFEKEGEYVNALELGRYLQPVYRALSGTAAAAPWAIGLQALTFIGLTVFVVAVLFEIHSRLGLLLTAGIMVTNQCIIATAGTYMTYLAPFTLALLLAALAALCWKRFTAGKKPGWLLGGALLIWASAALYQSYLFVTVTLILLDSVQALLAGQNWKKTVGNGLWGIAMILGGVVLYFVLLYPVTALTGVPLKEDDYNSVTNLWASQTPMLHRILSCYKNFIVSFTLGYAALYPAWAIVAVHGVLLVICLPVLLRAFRRLKGMELLLAVVLLALLPVATLGISILNGEMHDLMKFALCCVYLIPILCLEEKPGRGRLVITALMIGILTFSNVETANLLYTEKQLEFDGTLAVMTDVAGEIQRQEGYVPGETPVAFLGYPHDGMVQLPYKEKLTKITGAHDGSPITHPTKYGYYYRNILQREILVVEDEESLYGLPDTSDMPVYPGPGSIDMRDGIVIVKFAE